MSLPKPTAPAPQRPKRPIKETLRRYASQWLGVYPQPPVQSSQWTPRLKLLFLGRHDLVQALVVSLYLMLLAVLMPGLAVLNGAALLIYLTIVLLHRRFAKQDWEGQGLNANWAHLLRAVLVVIGNAIYIGLARRQGFPPEGFPDVLWLLFLLSILSVNKTGRFSHTLWVTGLSVLMVFVLEAVASPESSSLAWWLTAMPKVGWLVAMAILQFIALNYLNDFRSEVALIQGIVQAYTRANSEEEILEATRAVSKFGFRYVNVFLRVDGVLRLVWSNSREGDQHIGFSLPIDPTSLNGQAVLEKTEQHSDNVSLNERYRYVDFFPETVGEMAIPLMFGGNVIGTLDLQVTHIDGFPPQQRQLMAELLAPSLAAAIHNHRLARHTSDLAIQLKDQAIQLKRHTRRLEALHRATGSLLEHALSGLTPQLLLGEIVQLGIRVFEAANVVGYLVEERRPGVYYVGEPVTAGAFRQGMPQRPDDPDTAIHRIAKRGQPFFGSSLNDDDAIILLGGGVARLGDHGQSFLRREGLASVAAFPIRGPGSAVDATGTAAVLFFNFTEAQVFSDSNERAGFETFSSLVGLALEVSSRTQQSANDILQRQWRQAHNHYLSRLMMLKSLAEQLHPCAGDLAPLQELERELRELEGFVRFEAEGLRVRLDSQSLEQRLRELARVMQACFPDIEVVYQQLDPWPMLPAGFDDRIEAIVREVVVNSVRHGAPHEIWITAGLDEERAYLEVADNGKGFDTSHVSRRSGTQLIHEEVRLLGGRVNWDSSNRGTVVRVEFEPKHLM